MYSGILTSSIDPDDEPPESSPTPPSDDSAGAPVGAIAGGVVGGVAGLALIALLIWYFFLRKSKASERLDDRSSFLPKGPLTSPPAYASPVGYASPAELDHVSKPAELEGESGAAEVSAAARMGRVHVNELPG